MLISPTEPQLFHDLGTLAFTPEEYGVDFMWESELGKVGVQRKQFPGDFLSSVHDGRLNREYQQMQPLDMRVLLLEGKGRWSNAGFLVESYGRQKSGRMWSKEQHYNYLASVQHFKGVQVQTTDTRLETYVFLQSFKLWTEKKEHMGLETRPAAQSANYWGTVSNRDFQRYLLQSLPIIGPKLAEAILEHLGLPFRLTVTLDDLMSVPGIGRGRAQKIWNVFHILEPK